MFIRIRAKGVLLFKKEVILMVKKAKKKTASSKKSDAKHKIIKNVKPELSFIVVDGRTIRSLPQLALEMDNMAEHIFQHHVNEARNDIANWIRDVIGEIELADRLSGISTKEDTQLHILKHIVSKLK